MSTPTISEFNPALIPYQLQVIKDIRKNFDYDLGVHEILLSGSVGSAKSLLMTHIVVTHCLLNPGAVALIGRKSMPSLRDTLVAMITDHIGIDVEANINLSRGIITFPNGSKIIPMSWSDKNYKKVRSYALSCAVLEEVVENPDLEYYKEIKMRVGRIPGIKENFIISATNPSSPSDGHYKYHIEGAKNLPTRHVYYSLTEQNPFLPATYIENLKETLTPREADRMLRGQWVELDSDRIYYNYQSDRNFLRDTTYQLDPRYPIDIMMDFNIGFKKPMSWAMGQHIQGIFHVFKEYHAQTMRTGELLEEMEAQGAFELPTKRWRVFGDASGKNNDTRSIRSDYDIIERFLSHYRKEDGAPLDYELCVPRANPPLRRRHNTANASFYNENKRSSFYIYKGCDWIDEGFRLTEPKKGADNVEDDSLEQQHVTTAITYWIDYLTHKYVDKKKSVMRNKA